MTTVPMRDALVTLYRQGELNRLVIDEAHTILKYSHFRAGYLEGIDQFQDSCPGTPVTVSPRCR